MRLVAIAQARMGSTRVPGKVMRQLGPAPVMAWTISALYKAIGVDLVVLATSTLPADDPIAEYCQKKGIVCFRGSEDDVLDRYYMCALKYRADAYLRVTCDCPFLDPVIVSEVIKLREASGASYASNINPPTYPDGLDVECFTFEALEAAWREASRPSDRDCLTQYIVRNRSRFPAVNLTCPIPRMDRERWVLDTEDDWNFCHKIVNDHHILPGTSYLKILSVVESNPQLKEINNAQLGNTRNERFYQQLYTEPLPRPTFAHSNAHLQATLERIPFAAQTFSKSHLQYPPGNAPLFASHADGGRIIDIDGNDYVDLVGALCPIILGYRDPDVDRAIRNQLDAGISFSLATELEYELSERLCELIPCAEMVKFGKNGTDVTSAAIRLARAHTGKDHVLVGGYHGWADWSMSTSDRNLGIPAAVKELSHKYPQGWHNFDAAKTAAIIVEPDSDPQGLQELRALCTHLGIVLIFDEVITGFRYHIGGAQALFQVTPDLACFGKAMANGMPLAALVGKREIMKRFEPPNNIFYSGTFFGETLSIAAALATIEKLEREKVIEHLWHRGGRLVIAIGKLITKHGIAEQVTVRGAVCRPLLEFTDNQIRTYFMREMIANGVLIINANTLSYAHRDAEMMRVISAYDRTFEGIAKGLASGINEVIHSAPVRM